MKRVELTLQGVAIAKWLRMKGGNDLRTIKMNNLVLKSGNANIYADVPFGADLPFIGEDSQITLLINPKVYEDVEPDVGRIGITAICAAMNEGIPVDQCSQMEVRVIDVEY